MPYKSMEEVNPALKGIKPPITLAQANMIADWADRIEQEGSAEDAWAAAIALFKRTHHVENSKWVKNEGSKAEHSTDDLLDLLATLGFEIELSPIDDLFTGGQPAYVIDLFTDLPQKDGRPDFSQPFRILPVGPIHRYGKRVVSEQDIAEFTDNWQHRASRGIRRKRVVIDAEHEPGGIGWYADIYDRGSDGLWARINLSSNGEKLLQKRDFYFFSPTVAWTMQDAVTGEVIKNQIAGGALTNYPVFGDATALPIGYSEAALHRLWQDGVQLDGYATKTEDGVEYPASAYLIVEDPDHPTTWHLRVKEYVNGKLQVTANMCGRAAAALNPTKPYRGRAVQLTQKQRAEAKRKLLSLYRNTLKVPDEKIPKHLFSRKGGHAMTVEFTDQDRNVLDTLSDLFGALINRKGEPGDGGDVTISEEAFATLQSQMTKLTEQVEALSQERDELKQQVEKGQTQLAAETYARQLQEMRQHAEQYRHLALPLEVEEEEGEEKGKPAPEHFAWLFNVDQSEGKEHWAFFNAVLKAADAALEEASAFSELGSGQQVEETEDERLHRLAIAYSKKHEVDYFAALKAVSAGAEPNQTA